MKYKLSLIDKYISKQLIESFLLSVVIFTSIMFASDTFLYIVKQIAMYGIPFKVAFMVVVLKLPFIVVLTIPMGVLLSTIVTFNKLNNNSELTIFRACGVSVVRLAMPAIIFGLIAGTSAFVINEYVVPAANMQSRNLMAWALTQRNIPEGKTSFSFKELNSYNQIKRLFYVDKYENKKLQGITVLDMSKKGAVQVIQSKYADTTPEYWGFKNGVVYTISNSGKVLNTTIFEKLKLFSSLDLADKYKNIKAKELNFFQLANYIKKQSQLENKHLGELKVQLHEKIALPLTAFLVTIVGIPLAMSPPRARFNRGFLFSILIIFCYYLIRALFISLGEAEILMPELAAWLPNLIIAAVGGALFYRKAFCI